MTINGVQFLSSPYTYALCLNGDWFQPFKHSQYNCGSHYVSIPNLPRSERYSADNTLLLGVISGPKEPELTVNTFLHNSIKACSKCAEVFPTHSFGDKPDYIGFNYKEHIE